MILQAPGKKLVASVGVAGPLNRKRESEFPGGLFPMQGAQVQSLVKELDPTCHN